jgi:hypothetical protein
MILKLPESSDEVAMVLQQVTDAKGFLFVTR